MIKTKICIKCGINKPFTEYYKKGKENVCKKCRCKQQKEYGLKHKEETKEYQQKYRNIHKKEKSEYNKKYNKDNADKLKEYRKNYNKQYYLKNKNRINTRNLKWLRDNCEYKKQYDKKWKKNNPRRAWAIVTIGSHKYKNYTIEFDLNYLHAVAEKTDYCKLCGRKLIWGDSKSTISSPTLDRMNNEPIMRKDNTWILCNGCNGAKRTMTLQEYKIYLKNKAKD